MREFYSRTSWKVPERAGKKSIPLSAIAYAGKTEGQESKINQPPTGH